MRPPHVRFGSKADIGEGATDVRFTPKSGHRPVAPHDSEMAAGESKFECGLTPLGQRNARSLVFESFRGLPHYAAASKGRLIRCTVLGLTPNLSAILRTPSPVRPRAFRASRIRRSRSAARAAKPFAFVLGPPKPGADSF